MMMDTTFEGVIKLLGVNGVIGNGTCSGVMRKEMVSHGLAKYLPNGRDVRITAQGQDRFKELFPDEKITVRLGDLVIHKIHNRRNMGLQYVVIGWVYGRDKDYYCAIAPYVDRKTSEPKYSYPVKLSELRHLTHEELSDNSVDVTLV